MTDSELIKKTKKYVRLFDKDKKYWSICEVVDEVWDDLPKSEKRLIICWLISKL